MTIKQGLCRGFINTELRDYENEQRCHLWLADDTGRNSALSVMMDATDCRSVANMLVERAKDLDDIRQEKPRPPESVPLIGGQGMPTPPGYVGEQTLTRPEQACPVCGKTDERLRR